jgi:PAS domain S-box-containing protein
VTETLIRHKSLRREAEELKKAHEASLLALASEKSQTHSLVTSLRDAVLVVNRNGEVVLANPAMGRLLGKEEAGLLRRPAVEVLTAEPFAPIRAALGQLTDGGTVLEIEMGDQQFMVSVTPFHSERGEVLGHIATISDISEVRRLALEKSRFIRTMIHEFRSPMGAVKSILEVALDKSMGDGLEPYLPLLDRAEKRLDGMVELIGNLLSLSKIEVEGKKKVAFEPADAAAAVKEVVELYRERVQARNLRVEVSLDPGLPRINVPAEDLRTLLMNLIGNAIKYNRDGGTVGVHASRLDGKMRLDVADTGVGIQAQNLPHVFDEFFREKKKETREIEGNGLGLAIVKRLVDRASGKIEVQSKEGAGSTFSVYLPLSSGR